MYCHIRNKETYACRYALKKHLKSITEKGINTNKSFWKFIKPFLTNKGFIGSNDIILVENNVVTNDEKTLASTFNKHYINIVEISSGKPSKNLSKMSHGTSKQEVLCNILTAYKTHPSIKQIEKKFNWQNLFRKEKFFFKPITPPEIEKLIKCLDTNKATEIDTILPKLIPADFLTPLLTAINKSIEENIFPDSAKVASVMPLDKGKPNKNEISNYRPVSVLHILKVLRKSH